MKTKRYKDKGDCCQILLLYAEALNPLVSELLAFDATVYVGVIINGPA